MSGLLGRSVAWLIGAGMFVGVLGACTTRSSPAIPPLASIDESVTPPSLGHDFKTIYSFKGAKDGANPVAGLRAVNGMLYGTTAAGGSYCPGGFGSECGTVFKVTTSGKETVLHRFGSGHDGVGPEADLTDVGGSMYGTTAGGGSDGGGGTVFEVSTTGKERVLHSFSASGVPVANLTDVDGILYGTTQYGGGGCAPLGCGTVFKITTAGKATVLYSFKGGDDGWYPKAGLIDVGGTLYGTTSMGGAGCYGDGCGTVFAVNVKTGKARVLYRFKGGADGAEPEAGLIEVKGTLYGTTLGGGNGDGGTVFRITTSGAEHVLRSFPGSGPYGGPAAALTEVGGKLYGTTLAGGIGCSDPTGSNPSGCGTMFKMDHVGNTTVLHNFDGPDGAQPHAHLIYLNREVYGTTEFGGAYGDGTVFKVSP